jgi:hypothetical protein
MDRMNEEMPRGIRVALEALEARTAKRAATVDVERVAARVLERLRRQGAEAPARVWWIRPAALRLAAAVVVLAAAGLLVSRLPSGAPASAGLTVGITTMDSLSSRQLEAVLEAATEVSPVADSALPASSTASLDDLSEQQLETLLASLNGAEG